MKSKLLDEELSPFNAPFWGSALAVWCVTALLYARRLYPDLGTAFWLAWLSTVLRGLVLVCLAALVSQAAGRRWGPRTREAIGAAVALLTILQLAGGLLFSVQGLPPATVVSLLLGKGHRGLWDQLRYTGVPLPLLGLSLLALAAAAALGGWWLRRSERLCARRRVRASAAWVLAAAYGGTALVAAEQAGSLRWKDQRAWLIEQRAMPLYVPLFEPRGLAEYEVFVAPMRRTDREAARLPARPRAGPRNVNVFLVVLESFREDAVTPETAPNLSRFAGENFSFPGALANGNATLYAWEAIFSGRYPYHLRALRDLDDWTGAAPFEILRSAGFRGEAFASSDIAYFDYSRLVFGPGQRLSRVRHRDNALDEPANDRRAARELLAAVSARGRSGRNFFTLMLDSAHPLYYWPADFPAPYSPYLPAAYAGKVLQGGPETVARLRNRYKNSVRFVDSVFGQLVEGLKARGLYRDAVIAVVGDHGQEFREHGGFFHGSTLYGEQLRIPLILKLPGKRRPDSRRLVSQVDLMPTLLDYLGLYRGAENLIDGRSALEGRAQARPALVMALSDSPEPDHALLSTGRYEFEFFLSPGSAPGMKRLTVWDVRDQADVSFVPGRGRPQDYRDFFAAEFLPRLNETGLILAPAL